MKKFLLLAIAILGIAIVAYSQYGRCQVTGNVEPTLSTTNSAMDLVVKCQNYNNYMVNVTVAAVVVDNEGNPVSRTALLVIPANSSKSATLAGPRKGSGYSAQVNTNECSVTLSVSKCD